MKKRGIGVGCMFYGIGYGFSRQDISSATIEICEDGSVIVRSGEVDYGQGSDTIFCQIVAEELGLRYDEIQLITADTFTTPNAGPTSASRVTYVTGNAVLKAARAVKAAMQSVAEDILGERDLVFIDGEVRCASTTKRISFQDLAKACHLRGVQIVETAWHDITTKDVDPATGQGDAYATYAWASQLAEVEVDRDTGQVKVLDVTIGDDCGQVINPMSVEGQAEGSVYMGIGHAFLEQLIFGDNGQMMNPSFLDFKMPTPLECAPTASLENWFIARK